ncbi:MULTISPECIES: hypothetical protein [Bacillaceae]|uniref:hypothetical protein n=1 Tax=Bacillaceae TaxID=186817 RepID=UPI000BA7341B|nr:MULTISPECIES: hypothetical protein [Bacillaceae]PAE22679.1 hypothetical protein CHI10_21895 [Bacillus sp. 7894-2]URM34625.1 hypothetical protein LLY41_09675 [Cytobacillus firmus]
MRKMKKIIGSAILGISLLSVSLPAFAATLVDEKGEVEVQAAPTLSPSSQTISVGNQANMTLYHSVSKAPYNIRVNKGNGSTFSIYTDDRTVHLSSMGYSSRGTFYVSAVVYDVDGTGWISNKATVVVK